MADPKEEHGEFAAADEKQKVPVEHWIQHPVSDSSDYLDREPPAYLDDPTEEATDGADSA